MYENPGGATPPADAHGYSGLKPALHNVANGSASHVWRLPSMQWWI